MMADLNEKRPISSTRHFGGFLLAGVCALATDAAILQALTVLADVPALGARPISILCAMVVSWLINRTITFAHPLPPTIGEFGRFAAVSWLAQAVNYAVFAAILLLRPVTHPVGALVAASLVAMFVSYAGFRYGVFRKPDR